MAISNSGSNEKGQVYGGVPGDQTGREWQIRSWYSRPWSCVIRFPAKAREMIADFAEKAAKNNKIGYNQLNRKSFWTQLDKVADPSKISTACDADCSAGVMGIVKKVGQKIGNTAMANVNQYAVTSGMRAALKKAGAEILTAKAYLTSDQKLLRGDILLNDKAHTAINLTNGVVASACPYPEPVGYIIQRGSIGNGAKWVQWQLKRHGYDIGSAGIDGIVGSRTDAAIRKFQKDHKLAVDGQVGSKTRAALKK